MKYVVLIGFRIRFDVHAHSATLQCMWLLLCYTGYGSERAETGPLVLSDAECEFVPWRPLGPQALGAASSSACVQLDQ